MKQTITRIIMIIVLSMVLQGCSGGNEDDYQEDDVVIETVQLTLFVDDILLEEDSDIVIGSVVPLPAQEQEDMVFVGWTDGINTSYYEWTIESNVRLDAVFEAVDDVFVTEPNTGDFESEIIITGYSGQATILYIPQQINGSVVTGIGPNAFEDSKLTEVYIPRDAIVWSFAFLNSTQLKKVSIYGEYLARINEVINQETYDKYLTQSEQNCVIESGSEDDLPIQYQTGCPIYQVTRINSVIVNGVPYTQYDVTIDPTYIEEYSMHIVYEPWAFQGATALEELLIPKGCDYLFFDIFEGANNIKRFVVEDGNFTYTSIDGVIYSEDETRLIYYPPAKEGSNFRIPEDVILSSTAFFQNHTIETFTVPSGYVEDFELMGLINLKEIIVEEGNTVYHTVDGVLFHDLELVKYPSAKEDTTYTVPVSTLEIRPFAFMHNQNLESIVLNDGLETLGNKSFAFTTNLLELAIPSSVKILGNAFNHGSSIQTIIISRSIIGDGSITFSRGMDTQTEGFQIVVPDDSYDVYRSELMYSRYEDVIIPYSDYDNE